jgi:cytochrome c-type biogenesis protein CcmF
VYALAGLTTAAFVVLEAAFLRSDFSFAVVADHSSTTTPVFYRAAAAWSSQEGSLLLWVWLLALSSSAVLFLTRRRLQDVVPYAAAVLLGFGAFFCVLLAFFESPFTQLARVPVEGAGLNPLLRHPSMMIHPPMLYAGYTLFAVPFAFAVGALVRRRVDADWLVATRRFALAAWLFLGIGILLGARWSYAELGWGGYWAWDPVENASLLPWLTGTAFLHSIVVQERRGMLKVWNASLVLATGTLCVLGTFLVRSGILDSIHAFGASTLGGPFVGLIAVMTLGSIVLVASRREALRTEHRLDSMLSREAVFLANNLVLVGLAFVVFWGTFFPLIAEALTGDRQALGPPWFDRYTVPLVLVLVLLSGIGPVVAWRRATRANVRRGFAVPGAVAAVALVALLAGGVGSRPLALAMFVAGAFVAGTVGQEFWRGAVARRAVSGQALPLALLSLIGRNRRRYGGYLVHLGMAALFVGVAASSAFQAEKDVLLRPGQSTQVGDYRVTYERSQSGIAEEQGRLEAIRLGAVLRVERDGEVFRAMTERRYYPTTNDPGLGPVGRYFEGEATSEIALRAGVLRDFWAAYQPDQESIRRVVAALDERLATAGPAQQQTAALAFATVLGERPLQGTFRLIASPMVTWIWLGALLTFAGGLVALWPARGGGRDRGTARAKARMAKDLRPEPPRDAEPEDAPRPDLQPA